MTDNIKEKIEDKVIDLIVLNAKGRLIVFKPENLGKDLIVEKRGDYKKKVISLNIYAKEPSADLTGFKAEDNFYLIFVGFDVLKQDVNDDFWLVPSLEINKNKSDFSKFLINKKDLANFLIEKFK